MGVRQDSSTGRNFGCFSAKRVQAPRNPEEFALPGFPQSAGDLGVLPGRAFTGKSGGGLPQSKTSRISSGASRVAAASWTAVVLYRFGNGRNRPQSPKRAAISCGTEFFDVHSAGMDPTGHTHFATLRAVEALRRILSHTLSG